MVEPSYVVSLAVLAMRNRRNSLVARIDLIFPAVFLYSTNLERADFADLFNVSVVLNDSAGKLNDARLVKNREKATW